jgi:hypothetical protein
VRKKSNKREENDFDQIVILNQNLEAKEGEQRDIDVVCTLFSFLYQEVIPFFHLYSSTQPTNIEFTLIDLNQILKN